MESLQKRLIAGSSISQTGRCSCAWRVELEARCSYRARRWWWWRVVRPHEYWYTYWVQISGWMLDDNLRSNSNLPCTKWIVKQLLHGNTRYLIMMSAIHNNEARVLGEQWGLYQTLRHTFVSPKNNIFTIWCSPSCLCLGRHVYYNSTVELD